MSERTWITFLTDYGHEDSYVGVCHGVVARIAPRARVIDVTHEVPPGDVRHGAELLRQAIRYLPVGVHLVVVDPGVGTSRRAVALAAADSVLVGPDNGVLLPAANELGGVTAAYELLEPEFRLEPVSATFHGRDIFAPAAAHLANGIALERLGPALDPADLVSPPQVSRVRDGATLRGEILLKDRFGNLQTSLGPELLDEIGARVGDTLTVVASRREITLPYVETFGRVDAGALLAHIDSAGLLAFAVNRGDAAERLALREGDRFELTRGGE